jgi:Gluconate 2-dehydrogenase subunit 3
LTALSQKLQALPNAAMAHMQDAAPATAPYTLQFFTEDENQLLDQLMEMIIPADDHSPGAHEAATSLVADLLVFTSDDAIKQQWRDGLRLMREEAARSSLAEALQKSATSEENPKTDLENFFVALKAMTVNAYYTSEIGIHKDLEYVGNKYLGTYPGCTHEEHQV